MDNNNPPDENNIDLGPARNFFIPWSASTLFSVVTNLIFSILYRDPSMALVIAVMSLQFIISVILTWKILVKITPTIWNMKMRGRRMAPQAMLFIVPFSSVISGIVITIIVVIVFQIINPSLYRTLFHIGAKL